MSCAADQDQATVITADEAAACLGLSKPSLYAGVRAGEIPCRRVGRRYIFVREVLVAWLRDASPQRT